MAYVYCAEFSRACLGRNGGVKSGTGRLHNNRSMQFGDGVRRILGT